MQPAISMNELVTLVTAVSTPSCPMRSTCDMTQRPMPVAIIAIGMIFFTAGAPLLFLEVNQLVLGIDRVSILPKELLPEQWPIHMGVFYGGDPG